ncbi:MAG: hypothetical protein GWO07_08725 [Candidatus Dadabacteria bacterium]|nr:hypothetical protein [Candidatus Dadabacteria bacterium]NIS08830.1 hypothetical protein [Candidatus Dadabacteria bacterium]NIY22180.1 hypothetical protein [Candidatus Dadabacteria bacterium]
MKQVILFFVLVTMMLFGAASNVLVEDAGADTSTVYADAGKFDEHEDAPPEEPEEEPLEDEGYPEDEGEEQPYDQPVE